MFKGQKGITLVALVITIIVLLILAGVSIAMLTGENGILKKSVEAVDETKIAEDREAAALDVNAAMTAYYDAKYVSSTPFEGTFIEFIASEKNTYVKSGKNYTLDGTKVTTVNKNKDGKTESADIQANGGLGNWTETTTTPSGD